jgi:hypothetical protein
MIQFFMVKARLAKSIASRRYKKDDCSKTLFTLGRAKELYELDGFASHNSSETSVRFLCVLCVSAVIFSQSQPKP